MVSRRTACSIVLAIFLCGCDGNRWNTGDRVLVSKCAYESGLTAPRRYDVVVFKYPGEPYKNGSPYNYIKRLLGLPGEFIALLFGRVHTYTPENPPCDDSQTSRDDLCKLAATHSNDDVARILFYSGKFQIARKPLDVLLAMRRPVFLNNFQPRDLKKLLVDPRWKPSDGSAWSASEDSIRFTFEGKDEPAPQWLRYKHLAVLRKTGEDGRVKMYKNFRSEKGDIVPVVPAEVKPSLITDEMSYNMTNITARIGRGANIDPLATPHWVGDLMLQANVKVKEKKGEFWLELSKGIHRFRARFDIGAGTCELLKVEGDKTESLGVKPTTLSAPGNYVVRLANFDARLTLWVNGDLPFEDGVKYDPPESPTAEESKWFADAWSAESEKIRESSVREKQKALAVLVDAMHEKMKSRRGPRQNDLEPASLGARNASLEIADLELWRDTYYSGSASVESPIPDRFDPDATGANGGKLFEPYRKVNPTTFFIQKAHYFCLGDNSPSSEDGRSWGTVPERLMLGRALMIYWPITRIGFIR